MDDSWIPPALPELRIIERAGQWLCLNPAVPGWVITTQAGALLLQLANGRLSVDKIGELLRASGIDIPQAQISGFFRDASEGHLYPSGPADDDPLGLWNQRRLSAMHLHLTDKCNLECTYCLRNSSPRIPIRHGPERFIELFNYVAPFAADVLTVTFTGGEPLVYPGFSE